MQFVSVSKWFFLFCERDVMKHTKSLNFRPSAVSLALVSMVMAGSLNAGVINNSNSVAAGGFVGACTSTPGGTVANAGCVGAMNLGNVNVNLLHLNADGTSTVFGAFDKATGAYTPMVVGDSYESQIMDGLSLMAKLTGKVWPVGGPMAIKAVTNDPYVKSGKPANCLINTSFLSPEDSLNPLSAYLDSANPRPVICSSPFQTHKRFKFGMQPATVDGVADGADGRGIDLVFNVTDDGTLRPYQVFSKIDNYTGKRLKGYKIVVGKGLGANFKAASELGLAEKLHISLGVAEGSKHGKIKPIPLDGSDIFEEDGLATFSHGLFGAPDKHFTVNGFFDSRTAGFNVAQTCKVAPCTTYANPFVGGAPLINSDTIYSTTVFPNNYGTLFGEWVPSTWAPKGIFWDFDNNPATDADLVAYWNGTAWVKNFDSGFAPVSADELNTWAKDPLYAVKTVEDTLNLGINYIVKVGDGIGPDFTVRIIPVVADTQVAPVYVANPAPPLVYVAADPVIVPYVQAPVLVLPDPVEEIMAELTNPPLVVAVAPVEPVVPLATDGGGGCTTAPGEAPFDPMLPLLAAVGLAGLGVRRLRRN
jgi:hypothetical protein